jgi:hypothetical protein
MQERLCLDAMYHAMQSRSFDENQAGVSLAMWRDAGYEFA